MLLQIPRTPFVDFILLIIIPVALVITDAIVYKISFRLIKGDIARTSIKWIFISFGLIVGVILIILIPVFLISFDLSSGFINFGILIPFILLAGFIDLNMLNMIHKIGLAKSFIMFVLILLPIILFGSLLGFLISTTSLL